jgi:hypothetical protein
MMSMAHSMNICTPSEFRVSGYLMRKMQGMLPW